MVSSLLIIESNTMLENIEVQNPDGTKLELTVNELKVAKDINMEFDQEYKIIVKTNDGKTTNRIIIENTEEKIRNVEELVAFRDKVNRGLTYEGKTINLVANIDLSNICGEDINGETVSFVPIGYNSQFMGIFDGNNNSIKNIFIDQTSNYTALFSRITNSEIKNLKLENGTIGKGVYAGGICAIATNSMIYNCVNNVKIEGTFYYTGGIAGYIENSTVEQCINMGDISGTMRAAGIVGVPLGNPKILKSYNKGRISSKESGSTDGSYISGGICASATCTSGYEFKISNCYNIGAIYGKTNTAGICARPSGGGNHIIENCYSIGTLTGNAKYAISGFYDGYEGTPKMTLNNNYWLTGCGTNYGRYSSSNTGATPKSATDLKQLAEILGEAYIEDGKKIDKEGNIVDNTDADGNIIYINNGYPVLKWQVTE